MALPRSTYIAQTDMLGIDSPAPNKGGRPSPSPFKGASAPYSGL